MALLDHGISVIKQFGELNSPRIWQARWSFGVCEDEPGPRMPGKCAFKRHVIGLLDEIKECKAIAVVRIKYNRGGGCRSPKRIIKLVRHAAHGDVKQQGIAGLGMVQQILACGSPVVALNVQILLVVSESSTQAKNDQERESRYCESG